MNTLSWLIYLADICEGVNILTTMVGVFGGLIAVFMTAAIIFGAGEMDETLLATLKRVARPLWMVIGVMLFVGLLTPTKKTVLAIAASELGQSAVESVEGRQIKDEAIKALRNWLKSQQSKGEKE